MPSDDSQKPSVVKKKWSPKEDTLIIELRRKAMTWEDVAKCLPGRSAIACRLRYHNSISKQYKAEESPKDKLATLYESFRKEIWTNIAEHMSVTWQVAEDMHWQLRKTYLAGQRTGDIPLSLASHNVDGNKNDQSSSSRNVSPQLQDGTLQGPGAPSAPTVFGNLTTSTRSGLSQNSSPSSSDPKPPQYQHGLEPGLAPIQIQPPTRTVSMLPGVAEFVGGVSPYSTHTATHYVESSTSTDRGHWHSSLARHPMESAGSKRRGSPDQFTAKQRQRIV